MRHVQKINEFAGALSKPANQKMEFMVSARKEGRNKGKQRGGMRKLTFGPKRLRKKKRICFWHRLRPTLSATSRRFYHESDPVREDTAIEWTTVDGGDGKKEM